MLPHELLTIISSKLPIQTPFKLSLRNNYNFIQTYISHHFSHKLFSTYPIHSYQNISQPLFLSHQFFTTLSAHLAQTLHYPYPHYHTNITKYTTHIYKKYTPKTPS
ncbi:aminoglycoside 6-adenylyltransferase, partial [Staphylococcus epidermidis]|uniref:aminoglycoside 6-adenylyltransferase n=1 Tax=Staphylococcus epidermidis TaxID=1282 RepID=UPI0037D9B723